MTDTYAKCDTCPACLSDASLKVSGYGGVAFYALGHPVKTFDRWVSDEDPEEPYAGYYDFEEIPNFDQLVVVMVGDDRPHYIDPGDASPLPEDDFCHGCGQIGCTH